MEQTTTGTDSRSITADSDYITMKIVDAVADEKRVDPMDLDPLYDVVDTDALDSLFHARPRVNGLSTGSVQFTYHGFEVHVTAGGEVSLEAQAVQNAD